MSDFSKDLATGDAVVKDSSGNVLIRFNDSGVIVGDADSGTNTGDVTLAAVGSTPSANGASLSGQQLTLQPADATHPGVIANAAQDVPGTKTFTSGTVKIKSGSSTAGMRLAGGSNEYIQIGSGGPLGSGPTNLQLGPDVGNTGAVIDLSAAVALITAGVPLQFGSGGPKMLAGSGSPESSVTAPVGSLYSRTDGGAGTSLYVKESGSGNTGWAAK